MFPLRFGTAATDIASKVFGFLISFSFCKGFKGSKGDKAIFEKLTRWKKNLWISWTLLETTLLTSLSEMMLCFVLLYTPFTLSLVRFASPGSFSLPICCHRAHSTLCFTYFAILPLNTFPRIYFFFLCFIYFATLLSIRFFYFFFFNNVTFFYVTVHTLLPLNYICITHICYALLNTLLRVYTK